MKKFKIVILMMMLAMITVLPLNPGKADAVNATGIIENTANLLRTTTATAATPDVKVKIDGQYVSFPDQKPYIDENNRTMVPVRAPMEQMGCTVTWDGNANQATIVKGSTKAVFTINRNTYTANGKSKTMDTKAVITNNRTAFPIRYAAETMGASVGWDANTYTVLISTTGEVVQPVQTSEKVEGTPFYQATAEQIQACKNAPMPSYTTKNFSQTSQAGKDASYELWSYRFNKVPYKFVTDKSLVYMTVGGSEFRGYMDFGNGKLRLVDMSFTDKKIYINDPAANGDSIEKLQI